MALLATDRVGKNFGGFRVLNEVSLTVNEKSFTGLVGPNGSGKTTLFNVIYGLLRPDSGAVFFRGENITGLPPFALYDRGLALAFQIPRLFGSLSVLDNLFLAAPHVAGTHPAAALFCRRYWQTKERELAARAKEVLELLELTPLSLKPARELSGGQRKLLEIGRTLMASPTLILLDEPAAGVNPVLGRKIYETLKHLQREAGITFFVIEHRLEILFDFADQVYLMDAGRVVLAGTPQAVLANPAFYTIYAGESSQWRS